MASSPAPTFRALPLAARLYIPSILALAAAALVVASVLDQGHDFDPVLLALAALLCAAGNLFEVFAPANFSFQPNLVVFFAAALLLPPWAVAILAVVCFLPGWVVHRFRWYMVSFNMANYLLAGLAADAIVHLVGEPAGGDALDFAEVAILAAAAFAFVAINHLLIALVVTCARGRPLRHSAADMLEGFPIEMALTLTGACLVVVWTFSPPFVLLAVGPAVLIYRALWVPLLEHKSRTDPKTGLYNSEYLGGQIEDALAAARREDGHVSVVMIDLDQLRLINNRHGHLAGDELIRSVAEVVAEGAAERGGIAARFGGDELCVLLAGQSLSVGSEVADSIRDRIDRLTVEIGGNREGVAITASAGVASFPEHADTVEGLISAADVAVYDAKLSGRNRTRIALTAAARDAVAIDRPATAQRPSGERVPERVAPAPRGPAPARARRARRRSGARGRARSGGERPPRRAGPALEREADRRVHRPALRRDPRDRASLQPRRDSRSARAVLRAGRQRARPRCAPDRRLRAGQPVARRGPGPGAGVLLRPARPDRRRGHDRRRPARPP